MSVPSPCVSICRMDPVSGWCEGCQRTIDEIAAWSSLNDLQKLRVWQALPQRRAQTEARLFGDGGSSPPGPGNPA